MLTDLPNILTLLRIALIPILVGLVASQNQSACVVAFILYVAACVTDYLDGALARSRKQMSDLGRMMDPVADKLLIGALLLVLAGMQQLQYGALYAAILIMLRELAISGLREYMASHNETVPSTKLAKWKTAIQMFAIGFLVFGNKGAEAIHLTSIPMSSIGSIFLWLSVVPTLISGWGYLRAGFARMGI